MARFAGYMKRRILPWLAVAVVAATVGVVWMGGFLSTGSSLLPPRPGLTGFPPALADAVAAAEKQVRRAPHDSAAWMSLGQLYHANGFNIEARAIYEAALTAGVRPPRAHYYLADVAEASGDLEAAARWLRESLQHEPDYLPAYLRLGDILYKSGDAGGAVAAYEKAVQLDAGNPFALVGLAREHLRRGDVARARDLLERLVAARPTFATGLSLLAQVLDRQGEPARAGAMRARQSQFKDTPPDDPWMEEVRRQCHDRQRLGFYFEDAFTMGQPQRALQYLDRMAALDPKDWNAHFLRGHAFSLMQRRAEALPEYRKAIALGGDPARIYGEMVAVLIELDRFGEAEAAVRAGLAAGAATPALLVAQGKMDLRNNRPAEAAKRFEAALAIDAGNVTANMALAQIHWEGADRSRALPYLLAVQRGAPANVPVRALLGQYFLERQQTAEAIEPLAQAAALEPENRDIIQMLAVAHLRWGNQKAREGDLPAAIASYDQAALLDPQNLEGRANKVQVLVHLKAFDRAEEALQPLLKLQPANPAWYLLLGDIQYARASIAPARASWTRASELSSEGTDAELRAAIAARMQRLDETSAP